jgi:hypothetical protein
MAAKVAGITSKQLSTTSEPRKSVYPLQVLQKVVSEEYDN